MRANAPQLPGGGGMGAAGIDWCINAFTKWRRHAWPRDQGAELEVYRSQVQILLSGHLFRVHSSAKTIPWTTLMEKSHLVNLTYQLKFFTCLC